MSSYDIIGDIHGQVEKLEGLLVKLGYFQHHNSYRAPAERKAVFLGDLIDRGAGQLEVLRIVRGMVENGDALCIAGNHEVNAVGFATEDAQNPGQCLRPRSAKNRNQHAAFLDAVKEDSREHKAWVSWFKSLPIALDLGGIRVVHADWDNANVAMVDSVLWNSDRSGWSDDFLRGTYVKDSKLLKARKMLTCGLEYELPPGQFIEDKAGTRHSDVRIARWRHGAKRLKEVALIPPGLKHSFDDIELEGVIELNEPKGSPVFIGHHWLSGEPLIESPKLACLDWSAAKNGPLVAYRWDGEAELSNDKLVW